MPSPPNPAAGGYESGGETADALPHRPVTSYDVARLAGVTQPTVSRAMRGDRVKEATRLRVLAAADSLGYVPSDTARSLSTRRTRRIGVVVTDLQNAFYLDVLSAFERELSGSGYQVVLVRPGAGDSGLVAQISAGAMDGVILTSLRLTSRVAHELAARRIPTVLLNRELDSAPVDVCVSDNRAGSALVADRLLALGHTRIGAVFGPEDTSTGRDRSRGFRDRLAESGVALHPAHVFEVEYTHQAGYLSLMSLVDAVQPPTALFCANDVLAIGALNAVRAVGLRVPDDLTVIGYDDMTMSSWEAFNLTTIRQDIDAMASTAIKLVLERIEDFSSEQRRVVVAPSLVVRSTDGPPRAYDLSPSSTRP